MKIHSSYMGDSLYLIARYNPETDNFFIFYKSKEQVHKFNKPYQLGVGCDPPTKAINQTHEVLDKDIILLASDG